MTRSVTCLPCGLAKRLGETGPHDCNGTMAILNDATTAFVMVTCACPRTDDHLAEDTGPDPEPGRTTPGA